LRGEPVGVGIEKEEEDHAQGHEIHVNEENDATVVPAPATLHAAEMVDHACDCGEGEERDEWVRAVLREVRQEQRSEEAEEHKERTACERADARIEDAGYHAAKSLPID
jgi:hypothetical protein